MEDNKDFEEIKELLETKQYTGLQQKMSDMNEADIASCLENMDKEEMMKILTPEQQAKMKEHKCEKGAEGMKGHEGCKGDKAKMGEQKSGSCGHEGMKGHEGCKNGQAKVEKKETCGSEKAQPQKEEHCGACEKGKTQTDKK